MTPKRYKEVGRLYREAVDLDAAKQREYLAEVCAGDDALRAEVEALLAYDQAHGFLDQSPMEFAALELGEKALAGQLAGRCRLLSLLGKGGMGEVWLAEDTQLGRKLAVKLLPAQFNRDAERVRRFDREARAASALNHPNILTIHEIGQALNTHYIVMEYVEGESLRQWLALAPERRLSPAKALPIAIQVAEALVAAHQVGVTHRDIKPENIMLRRDGYVKVLDFGLAKLIESPGTDHPSGNGNSHAPPSENTRNLLSSEPGRVMGTPRYMSPEQAQGLPVDARTDIFSLGVTLYEMVAGRPPFSGATLTALIAAILRDDPPTLEAHEAEASPELERILRRALCKDREERYPTANDLLVELKGLQRRLERKAELGAEPASVAQPTSAEPAPAKTKQWTGRFGRRLAALCVVAALVGGGGWVYWRNMMIKNARATVARVEELTLAERFFEAFDLAGETRTYQPGDPTIARLTTTFADDLSVVTNPPGARVYLKRFAPNQPNQMGGAGARQFIGITPISRQQIARGSYILTIEKEGYAAFERSVTGLLLRAGGYISPSPPIRVEARLVESAKAPARMTLVAGGEYRLTNYGRTTDRKVQLADFFLDKYETTNREYKEFIRAGGYLKPEFWRHKFRAENGAELSWEEAVRRFKDQTGLPGPRSWKNQDFPEGMGEFPVTDISWYEAAAYAAFRGKVLPTAFQWEKAARGGLGGNDIRGVGTFQMPWGGFTGTIEGRANFDRQGPLPVESLEFGQSPYGCFHMAGNVAEWLLNGSPDGFTTGGGSWDDPPYLFGKYGSYPALYISPKLGFRCALNLSGVEGDQGAAPLFTKNDLPDSKPVSDATFRSWQEIYRYAKPPLEPQIEEVQETDDWRREKITYIGAEGERALAYLFLPKNYPPPWQLIEFMPSGAAFSRFKTIPELVNNDLGPFIKSGRAVLAVVLKGFQEREHPVNYAPPAEGTIEHRDNMLHDIVEERRALDYAATRSDLDANRIAYLAISVSGALKYGVPALDPRFRSVIFLGAKVGIDNDRFPPEVNPINFIPRIRAPKLVLQGHYDETSAKESQFKPMWKLLREPKRLQFFETGHALTPTMFTDPVNAWLDETLGPVHR